MHVETPGMVASGKGLGEDTWARILFLFPVKTQAKLVGVKCSLLVLFRGNKSKEDEKQQQHS